MTAKTGTVMTPVYLTPLLRQQIKIAAAEKDMTMTGYIDQATKLALEKDAKPTDDTEYCTVHCADGKEFRAAHVTWDPMAVLLHERAGDGTIVFADAGRLEWAEVTRITRTYTDKIGARVTSQMYPRICLDCGERVQETPSRTAWRSTHVCALVDNQKGE